MEREDFPAYILLEAQSALLGIITPKIRAVSIEWDEDVRLSFRVHYESQPTEGEVEEMEIATTEIIAGVPYITWLNPVEVVVTNAPIPELEFLNRLVYLRKETLTTS